MRLVLSDRVHVVISGEEGVTASLHLRLVTASNDVRVDMAAMKSCQAFSKWSLDNPGVIIAHCIQRVLGVPFTESLSADGGERFNVYGPVALLRGAADSWYYQAKAQLQSSSSAGGGTNVQSPSVSQEISASAIASIAADAVTFHYVSEGEGQLLYNALYGGWRPSPAQLFDAWPRGKALGPYAAGLRNVQDATALSNLLFHRLKTRRSRLTPS
eukprot:gene3860-4830_t